MTQDNLNNVARLAQKYTEDVPVIVLGTGATIPLGLPSMNDLARQLVHNLKPEAHDIGKWDKLKSDLQKTCDLEKSLHNIDISESLSNTIVFETWKFLIRVDLQLWKNIITYTVKLPLTNLLVHFLRTANPHISIVTTNYDRMAEYAADLAKASAYTGFTEGYLQTFAASVTRSHNKIDIWKVHGSLDWFLGQNDEIIKYPFDSVPSGLTPLIVTPGITKYRATHKDPFRTVLTKADSALQNAKCFLCIGYGFNDEHVQPILIRRAKNDRIPLVVVTKKLTSKTREILLNNGLQKYLFIEKNTNGTTAVSDEFPKGVVVSDDIWKLDEFIKVICS